MKKTLPERKQAMFKALSKFLRDNTSLVADARDSNAPWALLARLDRLDEDIKRSKDR